MQNPPSLDTDKKATAHDDSHSDDSSDSGTSEIYQSSSEVNSMQVDRERAEKEAANIAVEDTKAVNRIKLLVALVLFFSTIGVAFVVYFYMSRAENNEFENQFSDDAVKVINAVGSAFSRVLLAVDSFMVGMVSYSDMSNSTWPFVTLPNFAVQAAKFKSLSKVEVLGVYPLVEDPQGTQWLDYSLANDQWVRDCIEIQKVDMNFHGSIFENWDISPTFYNNSGPIASSGVGPHLPTWQTYPVVPLYPPYNWDLYHQEQLAPSFIEVMKERKVVVGETLGLVSSPEDYLGLIKANRTSTWIKGYIGENSNPNEPLVALYYPILLSAATDLSVDPDDSNQFAGIITLTMFWRELIKDVLPAGSLGVICVIGNSCGQVFTYQIEGPRSIYLGAGDLHDPAFDHMVYESSFYNFEALSKDVKMYTGADLSESFCPYRISVYPSKRTEAVHTSNDPVLYTVVVVLIFLFTSITFFIYDFLVERRQRKVMSTAVQSSAIVMSLFPTVIRDRLFPPTDSSRFKFRERTFTFNNSKMRLQSFLKDGTGSQTPALPMPAGSEDIDRPIAELFPEATVMFADIAGFTAWSSVREPAQVFTLLENLYGAFDLIAKRRKVFKVETIGDSYVAVAGLPDPRPDHAVVMVRFARDCRRSMTELTRQLEVTLGPDTCDLELRFGLNSGPVTAGVLRGERSRFQLFGDTVNTASRMESTGIKSRIQVSQSTADRLITAGKDHWLSPRAELVAAKGKGSLQTYWVEPNSGHSSSGQSQNSASEVQLDEDLSTRINSKAKRLIGWNTDVLSKLLRQVIARRESRKQRRRLSFTASRAGSATVKGFIPQKGGILNEVQDVLEFASIDLGGANNDATYLDIELSDNVMEQVHSFVTAIAVMYKDIPFHNFEHASHATMSLSKFMSRILPPEKGVVDDAGDGKSPNYVITDHTFGLTSDPLVHFSAIFATIIHDVGHMGVFNKQLAKENPSLAFVYHDKSVAEQQSIDLAWDLLMDTKFDDFRSSLCATPNELARFRQLVVNCVMATDVLDEEFNALRNMRWDMAFKPELNTKGETEQSMLHRRATIVLESLIQASDVAHTMQHWHIYRKWNERLFEECYDAFKCRRADRNPVEYWYEGEIQFFDNFVIPLAMKLDSSGVFGSTSGECLSYAKKNREEWETRGRECVASMAEKIFAAKGGTRENLSARMSKMSSARF